MNPTSEEILRILRAGFVIDLPDGRIRVRLTGNSGVEILEDEVPSDDLFPGLISSRLKNGTSLEALIAEYGIGTVERAFRKRL